MSNPARRWRRARVGLRQLLLIGACSAAACVVIAIAALAPSRSEQAVIAALRTGQVIRAPAPRTTATAAATTTAASGTAAGPSTMSVDDSASPTSSTGTSTGDTTQTPAADTPGDTTTSPTPAPARPPALHHVFVITLAARDRAAVLGAGGRGSYLERVLRPRGVLLSGYHTLGAAALPDLIALISGQAPNADTRADCRQYSEFPAGAAPSAAGLMPGSGCVYPNTVLTLGDELDSANVTWRAYVDGTRSPCQHPNSNAVDATAAAPDALGYATARNPFVYFHSLLDLGDCQSDDVPLSALAPALRSAHRTPGLVFVAPDPCDAGALACPGSLATPRAAANAFLRRVVPGILASAAYRQGGALFILFTAASGAHAGPVRTGALVLSPRARAGTTLATAVGPYALLRTIEDALGVDALGRSAHAHSLDAALF